ncbi:putative ATPase with chaperone activity, associated with Flp pilus assembly [Planctomycetales bacterium 10988]|nr:putative ATPase with chaperone activity, associated with Flp pilus assembly [Planctomycetales bacterium 10988]
MRFLLDERFVRELQVRDSHLPDCYVRPGEYLHHLYLGGVKFVVVQALLECLKEAEERGDREALDHLLLHKRQLDFLMAEAQQEGTLEGKPLLGDPPPPKDQTSSLPVNHYMPPKPETIEDTGLTRTQLMEMILRSIYNHGRLTGIRIAYHLRIPYGVIDPLLLEMRDSELLAVTAQRGTGDFSFEYELRPPRGRQGAEDALEKTQYDGPAPVPLDAYIDGIMNQTVRDLTVTRRNIREAFYDLILKEEILNQVGPAINGASSIFLFGYPGNGKTSIAERICRVMGNEMYIPYAIDVDGQIIKLYDRVVHESMEDNRTPTYDPRWVKIRRPVVIVGGELTLPMLDLAYNEIGKFYEAPLQLKANGGIFLIDDFGRQQVRPMDLLNRWIIPLEKRYDYLTTVTGIKIQIPFEQILIFSTNLDPQQLADEAFLRRIKYKIEITDPDEQQWCEIWQAVCNGREVPLDPAGLEYMLAKWFRPINRNLRMCQPRDLLDKMISISRYNMERPSFSPDLIDAACQAYFIENDTEGEKYAASHQLEM